MEDLKSFDSDLDATFYFDSDSKPNLYQSFTVRFNVKFWVTKFFFFFSNSIVQYVGTGTVPLLPNCKQSSGKTVVNGKYLNHL